MDQPEVLSFDMGGTTAKACLIEGGEPLRSNEFEIARVYRFKKVSGLPIKASVIEMIEIGAGGGSIAGVGPLGLPKVGPSSAGSDPGPTCYGRGGTEPTVTDADLILGYLDPDFFGARHIIGHFLSGVIHGALEGAIPERVLAQGADSLWNTQITGEREDGEPFTYVFFSGGGMGARKDGDGLSATAFPSGIRGVPAEVIESIFPVVMHRREFRPDSEGPGRHRGGFGQEMEIGVRSDSPWVLSAMYDRTRCPAQGIRGGDPGGPGSPPALNAESHSPGR